MKEIIKKYSNGEITIVWKPNQCIHSTNCFKGLPEVFDPRKRPWTTPEHATTEKIVDQISKCPSGALSFFYNEASTETNASGQPGFVEVSENGPLLVHGDLLIKDKSGSEISRKNITAFCRCGASANKPFCDGTHRSIDFKG
jgi:uncharacterized Fe-S cluster protein YjdI